MPKVSVIMPSLNVAPYIRECLESVIRQTLEDIEIICIDAGSTDGTWEILGEYAAADRRIKLLHSEKKSYGFQMNLGLKAAAGDYIGIVETDDYILPEMYETLYTYAVEHDADFVKTDFDVFTTPSAGERLFLRFSLKEGGDVKYDALFTSDDYMRSNRAIDVFIWNGIYRKEFLLNNHIWFQETPGAAFQDCGFRYQVALCVKRGFFLDSSFYRYRRDNAGASTYNSKCVLFNLAECRNLLRIANDRGWMKNKAQAQFLAREVIIVAHRPYVELLAWGEPAEGTAEALDGFRSILKDFMNRGILEQTDVPADVWLMVKMFVENPGCYDCYAHLQAEALVDLIRKFLRDAAQKERMILFGSGLVGARAYCILRNSGLQNIAAFCDNDRRKWGTRYMGCPVKSPEEAVKEFPNGHFLITNRAHPDDIRSQLCTLGVPEERMSVYRLDAPPMLCTNMSLRLIA